MVSCVNDDARMIGWCDKIIVYMWHLKVADDCVTLMGLEIIGRKPCENTCTVQITFIFIGQTHLVFGKCICTCATKHSNAFRTFLNWLKNSKRVLHEPKLHISRLPLFAHFDLWSVSVWWVVSEQPKSKPKTLVKSIWAILCDVRVHSHVSYNVRCKMHQTRWQVKRKSRLRLKRKLKSVWK